MSEPASNTRKKDDSADTNPRLASATASERDRG